LGNVLLVAMGGAIGSAARHGVNVLTLRMFGPNFPAGTLAVNLIGCLAMGVFIEVLARRLGGSQELRLFVATGILGGFTTFSAFSLDFASLWERGPVSTALVYAFASVAGSVLAVFAGLALARSLG